MMFVGFFMASSVSAINIEGCSNAEVSSSAICENRNEDIRTQGGFVSTLTNTILFFLGIAAVASIIIGGIRYGTANGDASKVQSAKNTIMYSVVGLVIAIMAWAIVSFVLDNA